MVIAGAAHAEEVGVMCNVAPGFRIDEIKDPHTIITATGVEPGAPRNFVITSTGLETPWGGACAKATITPDHVDVVCQIDDNSGAYPFQTKIIVGINRRLGSYTETEVLTDQHGERRTIYKGTCQKREGF